MEVVEEGKERGKREVEAEGGGGVVQQESRSGTERSVFCACVSRHTQASERAASPA